MDVRKSAFEGVVGGRTTALQPNRTTVLDWVKGYYRSF